MKSNFELTELNEIVDSVLVQGSYPCRIVGVNRSANTLGRPVYTFSIEVAGKIHFWRRELEREINGSIITEFSNTVAQITRATGCRVPADWDKHELIVHVNEKGYFSGFGALTEQVSTSDTIEM